MSSHIENLQMIEKYRLGLLPPKKLAVMSEPAPATPAQPGSDQRLHTFAEPLALTGAHYGSVRSAFVSLQAAEPADQQGCLEKVQQALASARAFADQQSAELATLTPAQTPEDLLLELSRLHSLVDEVAGQASHYRARLQRFSS
jgi:hypothetical protein